MSRLRAFAGVAPSQALARLRAAAVPCDPARSLALDARFLLRRAPMSPLRRLAGVAPSHALARPRAAPVPCDPARSLALDARFLLRRPR